jgi:hypothetical protein
VVEGVAEIQNEKKVRGLENFMERSVIRSKGPILNVPLSDLGSPSAPGAATHLIRKPHMGSK